MKIKFMTKLISAVCAAAMATSCVAMPVSARRFPNPNHGFIPEIINVHHDPDPLEDLPPTPFIRDLANEWGVDANRIWDPHAPLGIDIPYFDENDPEYHQEWLAHLNYEDKKVDNSELEQLLNSELPQLSKSKAMAIWQNQQYLGEDNGFLFGEEIEVAKRYNAIYSGRFVISRELHSGKDNKEMRSRIFVVNTRQPGGDRYFLEIKGYKPVEISGNEYKDEASKAKNIVKNWLDSGKYTDTYATFDLSHIRFEGKICDFDMRRFNSGAVLFVSPSRGDKHVGYSKILISEDEILQYKNLYPTVARLVWESRTHM